jgi:hypothetical protein
VPDQPLSVPQTAVTLPGFQPVNPDAIPLVTAQAPAPEKTDPPPTTPRPARRPAGPPKPEADSEPDTPPAPVVVQEQAPIQPILKGEEQKRLQDLIDGRKREISERLNRANGHRSSHDQPLVERIQSFLTQCADAEKRADYAQADALSERALILAKELQGE